MEQNSVNSLRSLETISPGASSPPEHLDFSLVRLEAKDPGEHHGFLNCEIIINGYIFLTAKFVVLCYYSNSKLIHSIYSDIKFPSVSFMSGIHPFLSSFIASTPPNSVTPSLH